MWPFLKDLFLGGATSLVKAGTGVYTAIEGDQAEKDQQLSTEQIALINAYAAEFVARQQRTVFDSFADGLNRLVRPCLAIGAQSAFVWAAVDPITFAETMRVLGIVPEPLWVIWGGIWAFYFTGRIMENLPRKWKIEPAALNLAREVVADRAARRVLEAPPVVSPESPADETQPPLPSTDETQPETIPDNAGTPLRALAATLWGEARGESREGKIAVAHVILNRVKDPGWWGHDVIGVCTAKNQFSCWFDQQAVRVRTVDESQPRFRECLEVAREVLAGRTEDPTGGADHYYAPAGMPGGRPPRWAVGKTPTTAIGGHIFYKLGQVG